MYAHTWPENWNKLILSEVLENKGNVFNIRQVWILYIDNNQKFSLSFPRREAGHFPHSEEMGVFFSSNENEKGYL